MTVQSFDVVFYTLAFVVPGFICDSVIAAIVPRRVEQRELRVLRFLTFSAVNYGVWSWLVFLIFKLTWFIDHPWYAGAAWFLIVFVGPVGLGVLLGLLEQKNVVRKFLARLGIRCVHPIPTAWDYFFSETKPVWVAVTLKDGREVVGFFGSRSFASSEAAERDLYIQEVLRMRRDGPWERVPRSRGVLVKHDDIRYIEFWGD